MTQWPKATYKWKYLTGGILTVSEDESVIIIAGKRQQAVKHGARTETESLNLSHNKKIKRKWDLSWVGYLNFKAHPQWHTS